MNRPLEDTLRQLQPTAPQLDWQQIWLEQGRAEGRAETQDHHWWSHPMWAGLSLVTTAASLTLAIVLAGQWASRPTGVTAQGDTAQGDTAPSQPPTIPVLDGQAPTATTEPMTHDILRNPVAAVTARWNPASWISSLQGVEVRRQWRQRQQVLRNGDLGLEVYFTSGPAPRSLPPQSLPPRNEPTDRDSNWQKLLKLNQPPAAGTMPRGSNLGDLL